MSTINIVFQEKGKNNRIIKGKTNMSFSELIQSYYKNICASKKDKMTKIFLIKGTEHSPEEGSTLNELGLHDYSEIEIQSTEKAVTGTSEPPRQKEEPPAQEEAPQEEEPPQEEPPQEEPPQEEQPQEEPQEEQPQEEQPQENNDDWD